MTGCASSIGEGLDRSCVSGGRVVPVACMLPRAMKIGEKVEAEGMGGGCVPCGRGA